MRHKLRIACYGQRARKNGGSYVSANFLVLEELLNRGFEIDFYGWDTYNRPDELLDRQNLNYVSLPQKSLLQILEHQLLSPSNWFIKNVYPILHYFFVIPTDESILKNAVLSRHVNRNYDLLLFLGVYASLKIQDVPTVSWVQGPPQTEWFYINKLRSNITAFNGSLIYIKALIFYALEKSRTKTGVNNSDILICGSKWSKERIFDYGVRPEAINILPYPMDVKAFNAKNFQRDEVSSKKTFLWLGRIDPRKRLDLLMEAYALLLKERRDVHLKIVGGFRHTKGYKKLIDFFEFPEHVEYISYVDRSQVPDLIKQCDVLIQPSEGENFGSSVAEALCCGLPVIVGPTNGTKDYISSTSFVFEEYTPESLKQTMVKAIEAVSQNPEILAEDARRTAEKNFDILKVVDDLEEIFKQGVQREVGDINT